jgi:hypothetical protein
MEDIVGPVETRVLISLYELPGKQQVRCVIGPEVLSEEVGEEN